MWDLWHWDRFRPEYFCSTGAPLQGKTKKLITFITWLHEKPQACSASVASAAGPFTKIHVSYVELQLISTSDLLEYFSHILSTIILQIVIYFLQKKQLT
jgi:hypothetical protein